MHFNWKAHLDIFSMKNLLVCLFVCRLCGKLHVIAKYFDTLHCSWFLGICHFCWGPHSCQGNGHFEKSRFVKFDRKVWKFCSNLPKKFEVLGRRGWSSISNPVSDTFFRTRKYRNRTSGKTFWKHSYSYNNPRLWLFGSIQKVLTAEKLVFKN